MEPTIIARRPTRVRRLRLIASMLAISLVALAALLVPHVITQAHAAAPKPGTTCAQIPSGADPTAFTRQQMKEYGLPSRLPGQGQSMWTKFMSHARYRVCTPIGTRPAHTHSQAPSATPVSHHVSNSECDQCWSGHEAVGTNYNFAQVWGVWQVTCPPDNASLNEQGYQNSAWIGLGGDLNADPNAIALPQLGTDSTFETIYGAHSVPLPSATVVAWWETLGQGAFIGSGPEVDMFAVGCNDWIMAEVDASTNTMWLGDFDNNQYFSQNFAAASTNEAECIVEQPADTTALLDFGTQTFSQCLTNETTTNTFGPLNLFNSKTLTATVPITVPAPFGGSFTLEYPKTQVGSIDTSSSNGDFSVTWLTS